MGVVGISHPCSFFRLKPSNERSHSTGQITAVMDDFGPARHRGRSYVGGTRRRGRVRWIIGGQNRKKFTDIIACTSLVGRANKHLAN